MLLKAQFHVMFFGVGIELIYLYPWHNEVGWRGVGGGGHIGFILFNHLYH